MNSKPIPYRVACIAALLAALAGCGGAKTPHVDFVGEVLLDGEPVTEAYVYLTSKSAETKDKHSPGTFSASVVDGAFEFTQENGPSPGQYEIFVQPIEPDAEEVLAERWEKKKPSLLLDRNKFLSAVRKKGPIRVELTGDDMHEMVIELTSR